MWPNPREAADLAAFTKKILNEKLHFLCSENGHSCQCQRSGQVIFLTCIFSSKNQNCNGYMLVNAEDVSRQTSKNSLLLLFFHRHPQKTWKFFFLIVWCRRCDGYDINIVTVTQMAVKTSISQTTSLELLSVFKENFRPWISDLVL